MQIVGQTEFAKISNVKINAPPSIAIKILSVKMENVSLFAALSLAHLNLNVKKENALKIMNA
jgi:hypothetical protein